MSKQFNVETQTTAAADYAFVGNQAIRSQERNVERVFQWRDVRGNANRLPNYVLDAVRNAGYTAHCIGGTRFSHSVIGLSRTTA